MLLWCAYKRNIVQGAHATIQQVTRAGVVRPLTHAEYALNNGTYGLA